MADSATLQKTNPIQDLSSIISLLSGSSSTTSNNISAEGMNALIQQILQGTNGLGSISSGIRAGGGYNSTTQTLLTNDLVTKAAGQLAAQQAGTTTRTSAKVSGNTILNAALGYGANKLLGPSVKGLGKKLGIDGLDSIGDNLASALGLGPGASGGANAATSAAWSNGAGLGQDTVSALLGEGADTALSKGAEAAAAAGSNYSTLVNQIGEDGQGFLDNLAGASIGGSTASTVAGVGEAGWGMDLGTDIATDAAADLAGDTALSSFIPYAGPILLANQILGDPLGGLIQGVGDFLSGIFDW